MSGIYGYIKNKNKSETIIPNLERLRLWNESYGNDCHMEEQDSACLLGCYIEKLNSNGRSLSKIIASDEESWVIDAVIYNREELYSRIDSSVQMNSVTLTDEELLAKFIEKNGFDALADVNGDFAGALYNRKTNSLTLFRDHMGIRPLYYYVSDDFICFSTDLRGVLSVESVDAAINKVWIYRTYFHLIGYTSTSTEYEKIYCVRPASYLRFDFQKEPCSNRYRSRLLHAKEFDYEVDDTQRKYWKSLRYVLITEHKYWHLGSRKIRLKSDDEYCTQLRGLIEDAVKKRLNAFDGIAGAEFSGGLDSSIISILIKKFGRESVYCSWSKDPEDYPLLEVDERRIILEICEQYSINCDFLSKDVNFAGFDRLNDNSSKVVNLNPEESVLERYAFWPMLNTHHLLNSATYVANHGGKVVFTGHGGDEGVSHRPNPYELIYHGEIGNYLDYYTNIRGNRNFGFLRGVRRATRAYFQSVKALKRVDKSTEEKRNYENEYWQIISDEFINKGKSIKDIPFTFAYDVVKYILRNGSRNRMDCVAVYGAFCGVRYMFPFLDYRVIDFAVSIERGMYLKNGTNRYILKNAFRDLLPDSLLGEVNKYDPSFENDVIEQVSLDEKIAIVKNRLIEYKNRYHCSEIEGIFYLDEILNEIDSKEITEQNFGELLEKCECVLNSFRLLLLVEKARQLC